MKPLFTLILLALPFFMISQPTQANSNGIDPRLTAAFETEFLESLQEKNSILLQYYTFYLDNVWEIKDFPADKLHDMEGIDFEKNDLTNPNIFLIIKKYDLKRSVKAHKFYRIGQSNQVLVLFSENYLADRFNEFTGRKN